MVKSKFEHTEALRGSKPEDTIVFFGSGPVAARALEMLSKHQTIEAVITKPKPPHHKASFPVLEVAKKLNLPVLTVTDKASLDKLIDTQAINSQIGVLIDFGIIISQKVIGYFDLGIVNSHFSLLPKWRGADPITFAILNGDTETGVSLMLLVEKMDEGPILAQAPYKIPSDITTPILTNSLIEISDEALKTILPEYKKGRVEPLPQDKQIKPTYSHKLNKTDGVIDWGKSAEQLEREIRAFTGWPGSRTTLADKDIIITKANVVGESGKPGKLKPENKRLIIYCSEQALEVLELKPAGKQEMTAKAFLAGYGQNIYNS